MKDPNQPRESELQQSPPRERYVPPEIRRIQLSVDEALMSICKSGLGSGPFGPGCLGDVGGSCMGGGS